jgi:DNA modification methylase
VKDRPTRSHEYVFLFSKSKKYYYDQSSIKEEAANGKMKNRRSVWNVNTSPFKEAHFAVFPPELVKLCLLAGSKPDDYVLDPFFGSGTVGEVCSLYERNCFGVEINEEYAEIAKRRVLNLF